MMWPHRWMRAVLATILLGSAPLYAQDAPVWKEVRIDQKIGRYIPLNLKFRDETGRLVQLADFVSSRPVVLTPVYYGCPMLCTQVLNGLVRTLKVTPLEIGRDFEIVTFSFDPKDTPEVAAAKKANYLKELGRQDAAAGWHFLTGTRDAIDALTSAIGFRYVWDEKLQQFAHGAAIVVLTPEGKIARYFYGIEYPPRDLRFGLVEASQGRVGNVVDQVLLLCYQYDPMTGRYGWVIMTTMRIAAIVTIVAIAMFLYVMLRREWRTRKLARMEHGG